MYKRGYSKKKYGNKKKYSIAKTPKYMGDVVKRAIHCDFSLNASFTNASNTGAYVMGALGQSITLNNFVNTGAGSAYSSMALSFAFVKLYGISVQFLRSINVGLQLPVINQTIINLPPCSISFDPQSENSYTTAFDYVQNFKFQLMNTDSNPSKKFWKLPNSPDEDMNTWLAAQVANPFQDIVVNLGSPQTILLSGNSAATQSISMGIMKVKLYCAWAHNINN